VRRSYSKARLRRGSKSVDSSTMIVDALMSELKYQMRSAQQRYLRVGADHLVFSNFYLQFYVTNAAGPDRGTGATISKLEKGRIARKLGLCEVS